MPSDFGLEFIVLLLFPVAFEKTIIMRTVNKRRCCIKKTEKSITAKELQKKFLAIAQRYAEEEYFEPFQESASKNYDDAPDALAEDFFGLCDIFSKWKDEIEDGAILRILKYLGVYDGRKIDKGRLQTALRVICFIGLFCDDRNGPCLSFNDSALEVPFDDVFSLERFVRSRM